MSTINLAASTMPFASGTDQSAQMRKIRIVALIVLVCLLALAPFVIYPAFLMKVMCLAIFACAFNLLLGYVGLLSFGHAAFFGMASYVSAHAAKNWGLTPELALLAGTAAGTVLGAAFGAIAIRHQGIYFATITLALAQMIYFFSVQAPGFTGGEDGIQGIPRGNLFGLINVNTDAALYVFVAAIFVASLVFIIRIIDSPFGQVLRAIRENEARAVSLGYRVNTYKLIAFTISAGLAGLAGALKAIVTQVATLNDVYWTMSGEPIVMTLVGGLGTVAGPAIGALVFGFLQNYLSQLGSLVTFIEGLVFFVCVMFFRNGFIGFLPLRLRKWL